MFRENPAVLEELLYCLTYIARADGTMHPEEIRYLRVVAEIFDLDEAAFERVTELRTAHDGADPYRVLGVPRDIADSDLKPAYLKLARENHPYRLTAQGLPEEFVDLANCKLAAIQAGYYHIPAAAGHRN